MPPREEQDPGEVPARNVDLDPWQKKEHEVVFHTLEHALGRVRFPASKSEIARDLGDVGLTLPHEKRENDAMSEGQAEARVSDLPLVKYVQALPDRRYESAEDVTTTLDAKWQDVRSLRDAGWEAAANRREE